MSEKKITDLLLYARIVDVPGHPFDILILFGEIAHTSEELFVLIGNKKNPYFMRMCLFSLI